jgi:hypothetical protein
MGANFALLQALQSLKSAGIIRSGGYLSTCAVSLNAPDISSYTVLNIFAFRR